MTPFGLAALRRGRGGLGDHIIVLGEWHPLRGEGSRLRCVAKPLLPTQCNRGMRMSAALSETQGPWLVCCESRRGHMLHRFGSRLCACSALAKANSDGHRHAGGQQISESSPRRPDFRQNEDKEGTVYTSRLLLQCMCDSSDHSARISSRLSPARLDDRLGRTKMRLRHRICLQCGWGLAHPEPFWLKPFLSRPRQHSPSAKNTPGRVHHASRRRLQASPSRTFSFARGRGRAKFVP